ncbi:phosphatidate cytidylyltransferase [Aeromicrobium sp. HA]|uniref:phosphatidate cytidylyltransferase n=1 Tax=Aeromicrobium sp. HA TaxID=3009077 RepID=UPI0022B0488D|nr:phosphatidate cytidylyltransferase [Aeromicrobium sp. HA]
MVSVESLVPWIGGALVIGGIAVLASRRGELIRRWLIWAGAVPVVVALFWWGGPGTALLASVAGIVAAIELGILLGLRREDVVVLGVALVGVVGTAWLEPDLVLHALGAGALLVVAPPLLQGDADEGLRRISGGLLGLAWLAPLAGLVTLGGTALALFVAVSVADIVAFFAGPRLGGPRLSPLSPAKRWSGLLVGAAAGIAVLALLGALTWPTAIAVAVGAPAGDLLESLVKRGVRAKDSGTMMAGAGGLLDRIDSTLLALATVLLLS